MYMKMHLKLKLLPFLGVKNARVRLDVLLKDLIKKSEER